MKLSIDVVLTDVDERYRPRLANGVLTYSARPQKGEADATLTTTLRVFPHCPGWPVGRGPRSLGIELRGDPDVLGRLTALLDPGDKNFAIVTP